MQKLISKYGLAAHLALVAVAPLFLFPFCGSEWTARVLLWLAGIGAVWTLMEPSRRAGEMLHDARERVGSAVIRDPLFWVLVLLIVLAGVRALNGGIAMRYDPETTEWFISEPTCPAFPGCVSGAGFLGFAVVTALTVVIQGCRHALGKSARISFLFSLSLFSGIAAVTAVSASAFGHAGARVLVTCAITEGTFVGSAFGALFLCAIVALAGGLECGWNRYFLLFAFAIGANAAGLYFFAPTPVILLYAGAGVLALLVSCVYVTLTLGSVSALKCVAALIIALALTVLCAMGLAPEGLNESRLAFLEEDGVLFPPVFEQVRGLLSGIAAKVWNEHPWLGTGLGSFGLDIRFNLAETDWKIVSGAQTCALNGWWQLLVERGIVGALSFALVLGCVMFTFFRRLVVGIRKPFFHPGCWLAPIMFLAVAVEAFIDSSFLRPEMILAVGSVLTTAASTLPVVKSADESAVK